MADRVYSAQLVMTADVKQAKAQLDSLQTSLNQLLKAQASNNVGEGLRGQFSDTLKVVNQLKTTLQESVNINTGKLDISKFSQSLSQSNMTLQKYKQQLSTLGRSGDQAFTELAQAVASAEVPLKRSNALMKDFAVTMKNTVKWQLSSSIMHGFMGALQTSYGYAQDLNKSLNNIRIVSGQNAEQMAKFAKEANKAAKALSVTTTAYTDASLIYYQQGLTDSEVKARTNITTRVSNVTGESVEEVSNYLTAIWNNFDDGSKSLEYYADVMTALGAATASSTDEIATGLEKFAAVAETVGLSYEYATTALATITAETRQNADVVGNALKTLFSRVQGLNLGETMDDGTTLNKYSQALDKIGISIKDANGEVKQMDTILNELGAKWGTLSKDTQIATAQTVAGVRQYTQLIALMDNWSTFQENLNTAYSSTGELERQAEVYAESWEASSKRVRAAAEGIYDSLIDEDFFIGINNTLEGTLSTVERLIDALGGMPGLLSLIGTIGLKSLGPELSAGISTAINNIPIMSGGYQKIAKQTAIEANDIITSLYSDDYINGIKDADEYATVKSARKKADWQNKILKSDYKFNDYESKLIKNYVDSYDNLLKDQATNEKYLTDIKTELDHFKYDVFPEDFDNEYSKYTKLLKKEEKYLTNDDISYRDNFLRSYGAENVNRYTQLKSQEARREKDKSSYKTNIEQAEKDIQNLTEGNFENIPVDSVKIFSDSLVSGLQGLTSFTLGVNSLQSAIQALNNEDLSFGEKFSSVVMSVGFGLPSLINGFKALGNMTNQISLAFQSGLIPKMIAATAGIKGQTIAEINAAVVKKAYNKEIDVSTISKTKDTIAGIVNQKVIKKVTQEEFKRGAALGLSNAQVAENIRLKLKQIVIEKSYLSILKKGLLTIAPYIVGIAALTATITLLIKAIEKAKKNSLEGVLKNSEESAEALRTKLEETKQKANELNSAFDSYNNAQKALESCTRGTEEWKNALSSANEEALKLLKLVPELEYDTDPATGEIIINPKDIKKYQSKINQGVIAEEYGVLKADQRVDQDRYNLNRANTISQIIKEGGISTSSYDAYTVGNAAAYETEAQRTAIQKILSENYDQLGTMTKEQLENLFSGYESLFNPGIIDNLIQVIQDNQQVINDNNRTLERNNELLTLEQENAIRNLDEEFADRDGEVQLTNAIVNKTTETNKKIIENELNKYSGSDRNIQEGSETEKILNEFFGEGNWLNQGNIVRSDGTFVVQVKSTEGEYEEKTYNTKSIIDSVAASRAMKDAGMANEDANRVLDIASEGLTALIKDGNLENASQDQLNNILTNLSSYSKEWQLLKEYFGVDNLYTFVNEEKERVQEAYKELWSWSPESAEVFKDTSLYVAEGLSGALRQAYLSLGKDGKQQLENTLSEMWGSIDLDQQDDFINLINSFDWESPDAVNRFKNELLALGIAFNDVDVSAFVSQMTKVAGELPIDKLDNFISRLETLYKLLGDVKVGDIISKEQVEQLGDTIEGFWINSEEFMVQNKKSPEEVSEEIVEKARYGQELANSINNTSVQDYFDTGEMGDATAKTLLGNAITLSSNSDALRQFLSLDKDINIAELTETEAANYLEQLRDAHNADLNTLIAKDKEQRLYNYNNINDLTSDKDFNFYDETSRNALYKLGADSEEYATAFQKYNKALNDNKDDTDACAAAAEEFSNQIKEIEVNKAAQSIGKLTESLDDLKGNEYNDAIRDIQQQLENAFGVKVSEEYIKNRDHILNAWSKGEIDTKDLLADINENKGFIDIELNLASESISNIQEKIDELIDDETGTVTLNVKGEADLNDLITQLLTANASAQDVATWLAAVGQTKLSPEGFQQLINALSLMQKGLALSSSNPFQAEKFLVQAESQLADLGFSGTIPANADPDMENILSALGKNSTQVTDPYQGTGGGGGSSSSAYDELQDKRMSASESKRKRLEAQREGLNPEDASKYIKEEIELLEEEQEILEDQIKTWKKLLKEKVKEFNAKHPEFEIKLTDDGEIANLSDLYAQMEDKYQEILQETGSEDKAEAWLRDISFDLDQATELQSKIDDNVASIADKEREQAEKALEDITNRIDWRVKQIDYQIERLNYYQEKLLLQAHGNKQTIEAMLEGFQYQEQEMLQLFEKGATLRQGIDELNAAKAQYPGYEQMFDEQILEYQSDLIDVNKDILELRKEMEELVQNVLELALEEIDIQTDRLDKYVSMLDHFNNIIDLSGRTMLDQTLKVRIGTMRVETMVNKMGILKQQMDGLAAATKQAQEALANRAADNDETSVKFWENQVEELKHELESASEEFLGSWEETLNAAAELFEMRMELAVNTMSDALSPFSTLELFQQNYEQAKTIQDEYLDDATKLYELNKLNRQLNSAIQDENDLLAKSKLRDIQQQIYELQKAGVDMSQFDLDILQKRYDLQLAEIALMEAQNSKTSMRLVRDAAGNWTYAYDADEESIEDATQKYEDALFELDQLAKDYIDDVSQQLIENQIEYKDALMDLDKNAADYQDQLIALQEYYTERQRYLLDELNKGVEESGILFHDTLYGQMTDIYDYEDAYNHFLENSNLTISELMVNYKDWQGVVEQAMNVAGTSWETFGADTEGTLGSLETYVQQLCDEISELVDVLMAYVSQAIGMVEEWQAKYSKRTDEELAKNEAYINNTITSGGGGAKKGSGDISRDVTEALYNDINYLQSDDYKQLMADRASRNPEKSGYISNEDLENVLIKASQGNSTANEVVKHIANGGSYNDEVIADKLDKLKGGYTDSQNSESYLARIDLEDLKKFSQKFDTGGYTGSWGSEGRLALLHEKELILNKQDTANILDAVRISRSIDNQISMMTANTDHQLRSMLGSTKLPIFDEKAIEQNVHINAEFPNVVDQYEIQEALSNLSNDASQYLNLSKI